MTISPRNTTLLIVELNAKIAMDPVRVTNQTSERPRTERMAEHLPLVHRTGTPRHRFSDILSDGELRPWSTPTDRDDRLDLSPAVYFFLGSGAYPKGYAALLLEVEEVAGPKCQFTPFDSGALDAPPPPLHASPPPPPPPYVVPAAGSGITGWSVPGVRAGKLAEYTGGADTRALRAFATAYIPAHFRDSLDYVRRLDGEPDWPAYHHLESLPPPGAPKDRRAWTIEVRAAKRVPLRSDVRILLDDLDLGEGLSPSRRVNATLAEGRGTFTARIAQHIERLVAE